MNTYAVFTYGTLQIPAIMTAVTGRSFEFLDASLPGYRRFRIRQQVFPGIIPCSGKSVTGVVYRDIDESAMVLLDRFEDELYERRSVSVYADGVNIPAEVYIVAARYRKLLDYTPWSLDLFRRHHMQHYLTSCRNFYSAQMSELKPDT